MCIGAPLFPHRVKGGIVAPSGVTLPLRTIAYGPPPELESHLVPSSYVKLWGEWVSRTHNHCVPTSGTGRATVCRNSEVRGGSLPPSHLPPSPYCYTCSVRASGDAWWGRGGLCLMAIVNRVVHVSFPLSVAVGEWGVGSFDHSASGTAWSILEGKAPQDF